MLYFYLLDNKHQMRLADFCRYHQVERVSFDFRVYAHHALSPMSILSQIGTYQFFEDTVFFVIFIHFSGIISKVATFLHMSKTLSIVGKTASVYTALFK